METLNPTPLQRLETILDIRYLIRQVFRLKWFFVALGIICGSVGYFVAKFSSPQYRSHLTFALDDGNSGTSNIISLASELGLNMNRSSDVFNGDNILTILKSRRIIESVLLTTDTLSGTRTTFIDKFLINNKFFEKGAHKNLHFPAALSRSQLSYSQDSLLKGVYKIFSDGVIKVDRIDKLTSIYLLEVTSPSEEFTKKFTDELIKQANNFYLELRTQKNKQTLDILEQRANEIREGLDASIAGKASAQDANLNPAFSKAQVPITKQQTNIQVFGGAYAEIFKNLEIARFQYLNSRPLMQIIDNSNYPMDKIRRGKLETALIFAIVACLVLFIILWLRRIYIISTSQL